MNETRVRKTYKVLGEHAVQGWELQERVRMWMFPWPKMWVTRGWWFTEEEAERAEANLPT
jgi:hypothetical protein